MTHTPIHDELRAHLKEELSSGRMTRAQFIRRATVLGLSFSSIGSILAACGDEAESTSSTATTVAPGTSSTSAAGGGIIRVGAIQPTAALNPLQAEDDGTITTLQQVYEYLVWLEPDSSLRPVLAESWAPNATADEWTFNLRRGVTFSDGRPFETADVVAAFDRVNNPDNSSQAARNFKDLLDEIEEVDEHTAVFHLARPCASFPYYVSSGTFQLFMLPRTWEGSDTTRPIGTGPFTMSGYRPGEGASLVRNPQYWNPGRPHLDGVEFIYSEYAAQVLGLQGNRIDVMVYTPYQGGQALFSDPNISVLRAKSSSWRAVHMRTDIDPWTDKRVRLALAYSLDRSGLVQLLFNGMADPGNDHLIAPVYGYAIDLPQREQDYDRARSLLTDAGYGDGLDVTMSAVNGVEVPQYVTAFKEMAAPAGFNITLDIQTPESYYGDSDVQPWFDVPLGCCDWAGRAIPELLIDGMGKTDGGMNNSRFSNAEFDAAASAFGQTVDESSRLSLANQLASLLNEETPMIAAYWIDVARCVAKKVQNVQPSPFNNLDLSTASLSA